MGYATYLVVAELALILALGLVKLFNCFKSYMYFCSIVLTREITTTITNRNVYFILCSEIKAYEKQIKVISISE